MKKFDLLTKKFEKNFKCWGSGFQKLTLGWGVGFNPIGGWGYGVENIFFECWGVPFWVFCGGSESHGTPPPTMTVFKDCLIVINYKIDRLIFFRSKSFIFLAYNKSSLIFVRCLLWRETDFALLDSLIVYKRSKWWANRKRRCAKSSAFNSAYSVLMKL